MVVIKQIFEIFLLGLIAGAIRGPMLMAVFTEVLNGGFYKSLRVVLRALLAETIVALLIILIIFSLKIPQLYFQIISILGAMFLFWLSIGLWKINKVDGENKEIFTLPKILLLTILSGAFWIFWITVCMPKAFLLNEAIYGGKSIFLIVFELGWLLMTTFLSFVFSRFRPILLKKNLVSIVFKFFAVLLSLFAIESIIDTIVFFLR